MFTPFKVTCPHCNSQMRIKKPELVGRKVSCPKCESDFRIEEPVEEVNDPFAGIEDKPSAQSKSSSRTKAARKPKSKKPKPTPVEDDDDWMSELEPSTKSSSQDDEDWLDDLDEFNQPAKSSRRSQASAPPVSGRPTKKKKPRPAPEDEESRPRKRKKKKRTQNSAEFDEFASGPVGWLIGGSIAGLVGALLWGGIIYFTEYEIGILAWGIGGLVGLGVALPAGDNADTLSGITAAFISIVCIFAGKMFAAWLFLAVIWPNNLGDIELTDEDMIAQIADLIVEERENLGEQLVWPSEDEQYGDDGEFVLAKSYPAGVWDEAKTRWESLSPEEQEREKQGHNGEVAGAGLYLMLQLTFLFAKASLGPLDILFLLLATTTAYRIGGGFVDDE